MLRRTGRRSGVDPKSWLSGGAAPDVGALLAYRRGDDAHAHELAEDHAPEAETEHGLERRSYHDHGDEHVRDGGVAERERGDHTDEEDDHIEHRQPEAWSEDVYCDSVEHKPLAYLDVNGSPRHQRRKPIVFIPRAIAKMTPFVEAAT